MRENFVTEQIIGAAIEVHRQLGPGLLESAYESCLVHELRLRQVSFERQKELPVLYEGEMVECGVWISSRPLCRKSSDRRAKDGR